MPARWTAPEPSRQQVPQQGPPQVPLPPAGTPGAPLDPYFRWAVHTDWRGMQVQAGWDDTPADDHFIQIVVQAADQAQLDKAWRTPQLQIPSAYRGHIPGTTHRALHFTARVHRRHLAWLAQNPLQLRWELALPMRDAERLARASHAGWFGPSRSAAALRAPHLVPTAQAAAPARRRLAGPVMAVIDFGCPFLNPCFADASGRRTRLAGLWDQGAEPPPAGDPRLQAGWPWQRPRGFPFAYGRELGPAALQALAQAVWQPAPGAPALEEAEVYRGLDTLIDPDDPRRRLWHATHGGHVLDLAGGRVDPLTGAADAASQAALLFVQLPSLTAADSGGASLSAHVLDGVRYVLHRCRDDAAVVLNISYGSFAGPHDGSALIEQALDELLAHRRDNFAIVLAAGNARSARCHARRQVRRDRSALLRCALAGGDTTDTFVELWYTPPAAAGVRLQARVRPPGRIWSRWCGPGEQDLLRDSTPEAETVALLRHDTRVPNGRPALVLLAVGPTVQPAGVPGPVADAGLWEIEVRLQEDNTAAGPVPAVELNAWIERDDPGQNPGAGRSFFVDQAWDDAHNTLSSLATGQHTLVAGGFRIADGEPVPYSSAGPQRGPGTMVLAACEEDAQHPGLQATATRSGEVYRMNGSSVAAPVLARRLLNAMAGRTLKREDWPAVLAALAGPQGDPYVRPLPD